MEKDERRSAERFPLDANFCILRLDGGRTLLCEVGNASATGLMLTILHEGRAGEVALGDTLQLVEYPRNMAPMIATSFGVVVWINRQTLGLRFIEAEEPRDVPEGAPLP
ncbi:PilZ domain-containing protein [Desulfovibrio sp. X2]|uniref:PilZ domain-containing protein n=1 Tax=Desulfovibrio sp. X2 TaxID=941449 RepID=UPI00155A3809|nr:PilZ domain-containing protein [Desulfovibrio sp. X2]